MAAAEGGEMNARWILLFGALAASLLPVWSWYGRRMLDGSDEPWGIFALVGATVLTIRDWKPSPMPTDRCMAVAGVLVLYAAGFGIFPPLVRAVLGVTALAIVFAPKRGAMGVWTLLLLSLPVIATMQFYLGYPLRWITASASTVLLDVLGLGVTRAGLAMEWRGESVLVDAPCSGVRMMWGGLALTAGLCAWMRMRPLPTLLVLAGAAGVVLAANVLRATLLFFKEAHVVRLPEWTHAAIGCLCFGAALLAILNLRRWLDRARIV